jgi:hypothetical protein
MAAATLSVVLARDDTGKAIRMDYSLTGLPARTWFAIFLNDIKIIRFRTDVNGERIGSLSSIPPEYQDILYFLGGFKATINNPPTSGVIIGQLEVVEDTFNDGVEEFPTTGTFSFELRYD